MAELKVTESHALDEKDAIGRIKSFEEMLSKYGVKTNWKGNDADLKGTGVSGSISVTKSAVTVVVKLGLLAKAAGIDGDRLKGSIERRLKEALGGS